jgi:hypothetical protein
MWVGLAADLIGIIVSIITVNILFGWPEVKQMLKLL